MIKKVDHVTLVVNNLDAAVKAYQRILHLTPEGGAIKDLPEIKLAMLPTADGARIELIEPKANAKNRIARFLKDHGEGVFGLSVFVSDFDSEVKSLRQKGVAVEEETQATVHPGYPLRLAWIPPEEAHGVWIELVDAESLPPRLR
jgi:catechol 2,3-dioxygenase-like lactoylglutathione lyase family enzyme